MRATPRRRVTRRSFLTGTAAASAVGLSAALSRRAGAVGPRTTRRPNFLFLVPDQHRYDWIGRNPAIPVPTPNLDRLAARGMDFSRGATVPSPLCGPARSCLASGMEYENCGVARNRDPYPADQPTFFRHLRDGGYHTMAVGKIDLHKGSGGRSVDGRLFMEEWGFSDMLITGPKNGGGYSSPPVGPKTPYSAYLHETDPELMLRHEADFNRRRATRRDWWGITEPTPLPDEHYKDNYTARTGLELLERAPDAKPWLLMVNFNGPHPPMDITSRMARQYRGPNRVVEAFPQPHHSTGRRLEGQSTDQGLHYTPEHHIHIRQNYSAMVENLDRWLGIYEARLAERGNLDDTVVIWVSDHGEMLGDHDWWGKSVPYRASTNVPLVMAGPDIVQGEQSDALVSFMDLAATCLDFAGVPVPDTYESRSVKPLLAGERADHRDCVRSALVTKKAAHGRWRMLADPRYKLIDGFFENRTLFDLERDPMETENVAAANPGVVARLEKRFASA